MALKVGDKVKVKALVEKEETFGMWSEEQFQQVQAKVQYIADVRDKIEGLKDTLERLQDKDSKAMVGDVIISFGSFKCSLRGEIDTEFFSDCYKQFVVCGIKREMRMLRAEARKAEQELAKTVESIKKELQL